MKIVKVKPSHPIPSLCCPNKPNTLNHPILWSMSIWSLYTHGWTFMGVSAGLAIQSLQLLYRYILISHLVTVPFKVRAWISWPGTIYCVRLRWMYEWADGRKTRTGWGEGIRCYSKGTLHEYNVITGHVHYYTTPLRGPRDGSAQLPITTTWMY